jgi:hypothetical protein
MMIAGADGGFLIRKASFIFSHRKLYLLFLSHVLVTIVLFGEFSPL